MSLLLAPMRAEARALARGAAGRGTVLRTGTGPRRAARAAAELAGRRVAIAGVGGGVADGPATGDIVVATELRCADGAPITLPDPTALAAALRAAGLPVHLGPVGSARHLVTGSRRAVHAAAGVLLVDTESYWLATGTVPTAVVRVVADTAADPLLRPATLLRLRTAVRRLPAVAIALTEHVPDGLTKLTKEVR